MARTREYQFVSGIEASVSPDPATPTADADTISKGFADDEYAKRVSWGADVADNAALKAIASGTTEGTRDDGQMRLNRGADALYQFDGASTAADDGDAVLEPDVGSGRWLKIGGAGTGATSAALVPAEEDPRIGTILEGCLDNSAHHVRRRWHALSNKIQETGEWLNLFDPYEGGDTEEARIFRKVENDISNSASSTDNAYRGIQIDLTQNEKRMFVCKKGENYIGICHEVDASESTAVAVTVDGTAVNDATLNLFDENGDAVSSATFSAVDGAFLGRQRGIWFFGIDPNKDQVIIIENQDSNNFRFSAIEAGFATNPSDVAIDLKDVHLSVGKVLIRNTEVTVSDQDLTFTTPDGFGRKDLLKLSTGGTLTLEAGAEGAMTQARANISIAQNATTLEVKNANYFPTKGFCLASSPFGEHRIVSYTGTSTSTINDNELTGVLWEAPFGEAILPLDSSGFQGAVNTFVGDVTINLLANGTDNSIDVSAANNNNKIDFKIAVDGGASADFAATMPDGLYSADLMPIGQAIVEAMNTVKALEHIGTYFADYSFVTHKWTIGVKGNQVDTFQLLNNTGANQAASLLKTSLGFANTDRTGALSYTGGTEVLHEAWKIFDRDNFKSYGDPRIKVNQTPDQNSGTIDAFYRFGFFDIAEFDSEEPTFKIHTDPDAIGVEVMLGAPKSNGSTIRVSIDENPRDHIYILKTDDEGASNSVARKGTATILITFPRGSHTVTVTQESDTNFEEAVGTNNIEFFGYRKLTSHAPLEKIKVSEAAFKFYEVRPKQLFMEEYAFDYVVQSNAFEKIDTITFTGTWASAASGAHFNATRNLTTTQNDFVDLTFTLDGTGGGAYLTVLPESSRTKKVALYVTSGAVGTNSAANLITLWNLSSTVSEMNGFKLGLIGLPAGQFTFRWRKEDSAAGNLEVSGFSIVDTTDSDENAVVMDELNNDDRNLGIPLYRTMSTILRDCLDRVPGALVSAFLYNDGKVVCDMQINSVAGFANDSESIEVNKSKYFGLSTVITSNGGEFVGKFDFCEAMFLWTNNNQSVGNAADVIPSIDGRTDTAASTRIDVKAGSSPSALDYHIGLIRKHFRRKMSSDMSSSTTVLVNDTRGIRVGQTVRVTADSQTDAFDRVASVSADTSVTLARGIAGFANFTTANNGTIHYGGFHRMKARNNDALTLRVTSWAHVPLPVIRARCFSQSMSPELGETAISIMTQLATGDDMTPPVYADGTVASFGECIIDVLHQSANNITSFHQGFKNITITGGGTNDYRLTAIRGRKTR